MRPDRSARPEPSDAGLTLLELAVAMFVMAIFTAIVTTGMLALYSTTNATQSASEAQQNLAVTFSRLDRQVRYASGVSQPGLVGDDPYVEYVTTVSGESVCTQLRLHRDTRQLQQRTWTQTAGAIQPSAWRQLASEVSGQTPFTFAGANAQYMYQRLSLSLRAEGGGTASRAARAFDGTFTALNTSLSTESDTVCSEGRPIA